MSDEKISKVKFPRGWKLWAPAVLFVLAGGLALVFVPEQLLSHWVPSSSVAEQRTMLAAAGQIVLFSLGGVIAVIGVGLSMARHGQSLLDAEDQREREAERRAEFFAQLTLERDRDNVRQTEVEDQRRTEAERDLRARFIAAVELLSADAPVKRTAGLYALAALGDDWLTFGSVNELQVCIDVMCGYLRAAVPEDEQTSAEASVRTTGFALIHDHLRLGEDRARPAWEGRRFPLSHAPLWFSVRLDRLVVENGTFVELLGVDMSDIAMLNLANAAVGRHGRIDIRGAKVKDQASIWMDESVIAMGGIVELSHAKLSHRAAIVADSVRVFDAGRLDLKQAEISDDARIDLESCVVESGGTVEAGNLTLTRDARLYLRYMQANGGGTFELTNTEAHGRALVDASEIVSNGGRFDFAGVTLRDEARLRLDNSSLTRPRTLDLRAVSFGGDRSISVSGARIERGALTLPNGSVLGYSGQQQPPGTYVTFDEIMTMEIVDPAP